MVRIARSGESVRLSVRCSEDALTAIARREGIAREALTPTDVLLYFDEVLKRAEERLRIEGRSPV